NALISSTWGSMLAVGAALGGAFTIAFGRRAAFLADAASFLIAAALIATVRRATRDPSTVRSDRMRPIADTRESLAYARRHPQLLALLASKMGFGLSSGVVGLLAVFATRKFHSRDTGIGLLLAARGVGVVVGPFLAARFTRQGIHGLLRACGVAALVY